MHKMRRLCCACCDCWHTWLCGAGSVLCVFIGLHIPGLIESIMSAFELFTVFVHHAAFVPSLHVSIRVGLGLGCLIEYSILLESSKP